MSFNSYIFILVFLPVVCLLYFSANRFIGAKCGKILLLLASLLFLSYSNIYSAIVLLVSLVINWLIGRWLIKYRENRRKAILAAGVVFNVLFLSVFKYTNPLLKLAGDMSTDLIMPVGISFYTFQQIAYLADCYHYQKEVVAGSVLDYAVSTVFFPKLIQGPITYHRELIPQLQDINRKSFQNTRLAQGLALFALGLAKKVLIADFFGKVVDYGYTHISSLSGFEALLTILAYTLQIYFDFSGYSDMAVAVGRILGFDLPWNFNSPYKALNISDFWKRWHITLTRFLTSYIYIPLGGNRKGKVRTYINILIVYLVSGLWHGVGFPFLVWGLMHGVATVMYRIFKKGYDFIPKWIQWLITFVYINITWIFFRAESLHDAFALMERLVQGGWSFQINAELTETLLQPTIINISSQFLSMPAVLALATAGAIAVCVGLRNTREMIERFRPTVRTGIAVYVLLVMSLLSLSGVSAFLYTNF